MHVAREFEQPDSRFHVFAVRRAESIDLGQDAGLLLTVFGGFALNQRNVNSAVEPVLVHDIKAFLKPQMVLIEFCYGFIAEPLLVAVAFAQRNGYPGDDILINRNTPEHRAKGFFQRLLADIRLWAFPARAGTMVIDVLFFLDFAHHRESAGAALQHPGKRKAMPRLFRPFAEPTIKGRLRSEPEIARDYRFEYGRIALAPPIEFTGIDPVAQYLVDGRFVDRAAARQVFPVRDGGQLLDGMLAGGAKFIEAAHQRGESRSGTIVRLPLAPSAFRYPMGA